MPNVLVINLLHFRVDKTAMETLDLILWYNDAEKYMLLNVYMEIVCLRTTKNKLQNIMEKVLQTIQIGKLAIPELRFSPGRLKYCKNTYLLCKNGTTKHSKQITYIVAAFFILKIKT